MPLVGLLDMIKCLSNNPYRDLWDSSNEDLISGAKKYIEQESHDHPERFVQANREYDEEHAPIKKKVWTPEERRALNMQNLAKARAARHSNLIRSRDQG